MKIGFFDSGLGGIKTLKDIIDMGLKEDIYFLADEKNKPYGTKSVEEVRKISKENARILIELGCKIIVVACNTATSAAIEYLRNEYPNITFIGTEPAVKLAIDENLDKKILVIATTITVNGKKLKALIHSLHADSKVELIAADKLVSLIEDRDFFKNQNEVSSYLKGLLKPYNLDDVSHIVLGCTHFPLVKENLQEMLNKKNIKIIDGNEGIGNNLLKKLENREDRGNKLSLKIINTAKNEAFEKRAKEILGEISYSYI